MMRYPQDFDVIVIGGGHAGTEAALASARLNTRVLLITHNIETIGQMSCNPAIGGIGKGHLVKEIDALGGIMAKAADRAGIQFRRLNARKGPAVQATRAQADRVLYKSFIRHTVENQENLWVFQQAVHDLIIEEDKVKGIVTQMGLSIYAETVVLTVGTFLAGQIFIGKSRSTGGRAGDPAAKGLADNLRKRAFRVARLKTGTPPRIEGKTVDFSKLEVQPGDLDRPVFSFMGSKADHPQQVPCYIAKTNEKTHEFIRDGLKDSPLYSGDIKGVGPRYCPSIEDKIVRFKEKTSHQIFIEPEGLSTTELYPNGISTSLSFDTQLKLVQSMQGFEQAHITRPGYAIEYDFFDPRDLNRSLETKLVEGLFFAGQINGTTGYEEAAAQGIIAGINAALKAKKQPAFTLTRQEAYIGVLIDDLITHGTLEPYRMFTSRAEHRLLLREDNADLRLTPKAQALGLIDDARWQVFQEKLRCIELLQDIFRRHFIHPNMDDYVLLKEQGVSVTKEVAVVALLKRPEVTNELLLTLPSVVSVCEKIKQQLNVDLPLKETVFKQILEQVIIQEKYAGYIERQKLEITKVERQENLRIPEGFRYEQISGLSNEIVEKLTRLQPKTLGEAARLPGITPAAISLLLVYIKKASRSGLLEVSC